ncbi:Ribosomal RNA small subunit methyltransferase F [Piscirickettsia salmonis]|uniref:RsmB/NOP family class I SAM-dependent RNA methyltransferase n=2 Tax=Piscirickettsia salmonis TaxID=1238 RepID=UPI0012BAC98B|nr:RsmB/NOP family class I SAM-dependent RNA methyltransferase [Piscirickettsia salmonis]QGP54388.1 Ribosomal RNA small subunit methyltransferase F [Piscirickettsia salmonis]QGP59721.1 Ribosomal RNA small subunit methyltransferase F [Piscirickettsia salmonis]QGP64418.1 Ribosomal RNA small subunit methyltransferase F [Piscirickettsia salmonis]
MTTSPTSTLSFFERYHTIIDDVDAFLNTLATPLPLCLWSNDLRINSNDFAALLDDEQIHYQRIPWTSNGFRILSQQTMGRHWSYIAGLCHIQEEVSMLPASILKPQAQEVILDLCAAPGGKTMQIAIQMQNSGTVLANDISHQRLRILSSHAQRLGLVNITSITHHANRIPSTRNTFDRILADVPCSCEGTSRKNPNVVQQLTVKKLHAQAKQQQAILRRAIHLCKPGGAILYSTCTYAPEENEAVLNAILQEFNQDHHSHLRILPIHIPFLKTTPALTHWQGQEYHPEISNAVRIWPHHNNTGGFFIALIQKQDQMQTQTHLKSPAKPITKAIITTSNQIQPQEQQQYLQALNLRFGINSQLLKQYHWRQHNQHIRLNSSAHSTDFNPIINTGLPLIHTHGHHPKVTSAGALFLGPFAQKNKVSLTTEQRELYLKRQAICLDQDQIKQLLPGAVFVGYKNHTIGLGHYRRLQSNNKEANNTQERHQLESLLSKRWAKTPALDQPE